jgi:hypothetical protein
VLQRVDARASRRTQVRRCERGRELEALALESLQREVQAAAPLAERGVRLGE